MGKGYSIRNLYNMKYFYDTFEKVQPLAANLNWTILTILLPIKEESKRNYYINMCIQNNLSKRELRERIKNNEYERLEFVDKKNIKINEEQNMVSDLIKNPIVLKSNLDKDKISEKVLKELLLNNMEDFLEELGNGFSFIKSEYKIKIGNRYNYIYNCFIVIEFKKEHIGQIETYMNYIDKHIKNINQDKTIGIIITKKDNKFIMEYCSDDRIFNTTYELVYN